MKTVYLICAMTLCTLSVTAQERGNAIAQPPTTVVINGQPLNGKVLEIEGKHFVAIEDLAQSMRGTISYGDKQITLTLSQPPCVAAAPSSSGSQVAMPQTPSQGPSLSAGTPSFQLSSDSPPSRMAPALPVVTSPTKSENGRIRGVLTYFFDFHVGNKPDSGSKVWLVQGGVEIPADKPFIATNSSLGTSENPEQFKVVKYSLADENGNFEMIDIPSGEYTLIMQSTHTKGTLKEKGIFGRGNGHSLRDSAGRVEFFQVLIKAGETMDVSKDFGPSIEM